MLLLSLTLLPGTGVAEEGAADRPNLLVIMVDDSITEILPRISLLPGLPMNNGSDLFLPVMASRMCM